MAFFERAEIPGEFRIGGVEVRPVPIRRQGRESFFSLYKVFLLVLGLYIALAGRGDEPEVHQFNDGVNQPQVVGQVKHNN